MSDTTIGLDQIEEEILTYEVSDEALETAAGTGKEKAGNYTLGFCSWLVRLPGLISLLDWFWLPNLSLTAGPAKSLTRRRRTSAPRCLPPLQFPSLPAVGRCRG